MNPALLEFLQAMKVAGSIETTTSLGLSSPTMSEIVAPEIRGIESLATSFAVGLDAAHDPNTL